MKKEDLTIQNVDEDLVIEDKEGLLGVIVDCSDPHNIHAKGHFSALICLVKDCEQSDIGNYQILTPK